MNSRYDLIVIGAGPAGMAAATRASVSGLSVALFDEQAAPGGQIYRSVALPALADEKILGPDYHYGAGLVKEFSEARLDYYHSATVWDIAKDNRLSVSLAGQSRQFQARSVLLATGAQERPVPFPGWTLPGVMTCGAAQILLKSSGLSPATPLVLAGSGPLLLLIACQLQRAGVEIAAVLETTPRRNYSRALGSLTGALRGWRYLLKGMGLLAELKRAGISHLQGVSELRAEAGAEGCLASLSFSHKGRQQHIDCRSLLVHQGVVPNVQLSRAMGLEHRWNEDQQCWHPVTDCWGESSRAGVFVAGDSAGIGGALAAEQQGRLAAIHIARLLQTLSPDQQEQQAQPLRREIAQQLAVRPFLDRLYRPAQEFLSPADETIVCRCEEVSAGQIRGFARAGCAGPNQAKAFGRAGMGPCQGRQCGLTVNQIMAEELQRSHEAVGYYNIRSPIKPMTIGELATLTEGDN